jgi:hypothetical protein
MSGAAAAIRPSPVTGAIASSTSAISSSVAPAVIARATLHCRQTGDDPMVTDAPTWSSAAVFGARADIPAGPSASPASLLTKPSSIIARLRRVSWNRAVWLMFLRSPSSTIPSRTQASVITQIA